MQHPPGSMVLNNKQLWYQTDVPAFPYMFNLDQTKCDNTNHDFPNSGPTATEKQVLHHLLIPLIAAHTDVMAAVYQ